MRVPRRAFLLASAALGLLGGRSRGLAAPEVPLPSLSPNASGAAPAPASSRQPVLFIGHGSPMNAIEDNAWSRGWRALGETLSPRAILSISAHWYLAGTYVTGNAVPETLHDFGGFPKPLFEVQYPAKGSGALAERVRELVKTSPPASLRSDWGLDHGTWSVLVHLRPQADVPVLQLSIDARLSPLAHLEIGRRLAPLREEGVLLLGSGSITHNLREAMAQLRRGDRSTHAWASRFDAEVAAALGQRDVGALVRLLDTEEGRRNHPTPEHWLPLLYAVGAAGEGEISYPTLGFDAGSLSMRSVRFG